jgi:hypothetical protein
MRFRGRGRVGKVLLLAGGAVAACDGPSREQPSWIALPVPMADGDVVRLIGMDSGLCLSVGGRGYADRDPIELSTCTDDARQQFRLSYKSAGTFQLVNVGASKCIDVDMGSMKPLASVFTWACGDNSNQQVLVKNHGSLAQLQMRHSGLCLDADHAGRQPGTRVIQWPCTGEPNQLFYVTSPKAPTAAR